MAGSLSWITDDSWPSDEGWPYPDADAGLDLVEEPIDVDADADDDLVSLHAAGSDSTGARPGRCATSSTRSACPGPSCAPRSAAD
jgi:hypothetical protein